MKHRHAFGIGALTVATLAGLLVWLLPLRRAPTERHLAEPQRLPAIARGVLKNRMQRHARSLEDLVWSVVLLDDSGVEAAADRILDESPLSRPLSGDATDLNALLPDRFFLLQDELRAQARLLKEAAASHDGTKVADAYGQLSRTCVTCHRLYLAQ